jgi:hypothetical protein
MTTVATAPLRALTVRQPWADAIARGGKAVENRTWSAPARHVGTRFLIHAAAAPDRHAVLPLEVIAAGGSDVYLDHRSAIVAVATLAGCHFDAGCCGMWGQRMVFHWQLADVVPLAVPVPAKGALGFWTPGDDVLVAVRAQIGEAS